MNKGGRKRILAPDQCKRVFAFTLRPAMVERARREATERDLSLSMFVETAVQQMLDTCQTNGVPSATDKPADRINM